jgi:hypothetical protein
MVGLALSSVWGIVVKTPEHSEAAKSPVIVPVPPKTDIKLPIAHNHEALDCQKLDDCLASHGSDGKESALKICVVKNLGDKGQQVWDIYQKAKLDSQKKPSLLLLKTSRPDSYAELLHVLFAQTSVDLCLSDDPKSPLHVPVPEKTDVKLPTPHNHEDLSCKQLDECLANKDESEGALKTCIMQSLGEEKGKKVWDVYSQAKLDSNKKPSLLLMKTSRPDSYAELLHVLFAQNSKAVQAEDLCHVPVPEKPDVKLPLPPNGQPGVAKSEQTPVPKKTSGCEDGKGLPIPHGHPEATAHPQAKADEKDRPNPPTCEKLDSCLAAVNQDEYTEGFEKCVEDFCKEVQGKEKMEKKDDPSTALCDQKGKEVWKVLAEASKNPKKVTLKGESKSSLLAVRAEHPELYSEVFQSLFAKGTTHEEMAHACRT